MLTDSIFFNEMKLLKNSHSNLFWMVFQVKKKMVVFFLTLFFVAPSFIADDWPCWRGPKGNGTSTEANWNPASLAKTTSILWNTNVGMGHSAAVIKGNFLYITGNQQLRENEYEDKVYCLNAVTGKTIWTYTYPCPEGEDPGPAATPLLDENCLYTLSREGHLFCFESSSGKILWKRNLIKEDLADESSYSFASSPIVSENLLILNVNQSGMAFDKHSGKVVWNSPKKKSTTASPVLYTQQNRIIAVTNSDKQFNGVDVQTGEVKWTFKCGWGGADPVIFEDKLLITGQHTILLDLKQDQPVEVWRNKEISWQFQSCAIKDNAAYGFAKVIDWSKDKRQDFNCLDLRTGKRLWKQVFSIWGSSIIAADKILILTGQGKLLAASASPSGFNEIAGAQVIKMAGHDKSQGYRRECYCWTNPVLANGLIYCRNSFGELVCVDARL